MAIKLFTWNLQRGATSATAYSQGGEEYKRVNLRYSLLQDLCFAADYGFIIEPGPNIRAAIRNQSPERPIPMGHCYMDQQADTQSDLSACRPILFSQMPSRYQVYTEVHSGAQSANRFPVGQQFYYGRHKLVVVALHSTSGPSGASNTRAIVQSYVDYLDGEDAGGLIVGGDFNAHLGDVTRSGGKLESRYIMPAHPTNQGAPVSRPGGIDGFFFFTNYGSSRPIEFTVHRPQRYVDLFPGKSEFYTTFDDPKYSGFWIQDETPPPGRKPDLYRVSDHCPVLLTVSLKLMHNDRRSNTVTHQSTV